MSWICRSAWDPWSESDAPLPKSSHFSLENHLFCPGSVERTGAHGGWDRSEEPGEARRNSGSRTNRSPARPRGVTDLGEEIGSTPEEHVEWGTRPIKAISGEGCGLPVSLAPIGLPDRTEIIGYTETTTASPAPPSACPMGSQRSATADAQPGNTRGAKKTAV